MNSLCWHFILECSKLIMALFEALKMKVQKTFCRNNIFELEAIVMRFVNSWPADDLMNPYYLLFLMSSPFMGFLPGVKFN